MRLYERLAGNLDPGMGLESFAFSPHTDPKLCRDPLTTDEKLEDKGSLKAPD